MLRLLVAPVVIALTALAVAAPAAADPLPRRSSGMAAEFPVGRCIDITEDILRFVQVDVMKDLSNLRSVPCTDPGRDYRVVSQVPNVTGCGPETQSTFVTKDVRVLCVVQDYVGM